MLYANGPVFAPGPMTIERPQVEPDYQRLTEPGTQQPVTRRLGDLMGKLPPIPGGGFGGGASPEVQRLRQEFLRRYPHPNFPQPDWQPDPSVPPGAVQDWMRAQGHPWQAQGPPAWAPVYGFRGLRPFGIGMLGNLGSLAGGVTDQTRALTGTGY